MGEYKRASARFRQMGAGVAAALLLAVMLTACGPNEADTVKDTANATVQNAVEGNVDTLAVLYDAVWFTPEDYGVSWGCFAQNYLPTVSYTVDKMEKSSTGYTAYVTLRAHDSAELLSALGRAYNQALVDSGLSASSSEVAVGFADQAFIDSLADQPLESKEVSLELYFIQSEEGTWVLSNEDVLLGSILGGFDGRQAAA